ncbi:endonuclease VII domain-containing protein [Streptomyces xanthochromogenes]|uniref:endonuclease VII domain-containing protein n=1 Tax=Streptomyces xanthochromogenes TaxID=67384 RepID=UPI0038004A09
MKWLRRSYRHGLGREGLDRLNKLQGGLCAICGNRPKGGRQLAIDHDHTCCADERSCGKCVRGLLCGPCNVGVGMFQDDAEIMRKAIAYLKTSNT